MFEAVLRIIESGLHILDKKTPTKAQEIRERHANLRREWREEMAKGFNRNDSKLHHLDNELLDLSELFSATLKSTDP